jgi:hypothetical protein
MNIPYFVAEFEPYLGSIKSCGKKLLPHPLPMYYYETNSSKLKTISSSISEGAFR